jgi:betaine-aldehyde dehydrogenase
MIVFPDADPTTVAAGVVDGMNFRMTAGQSCGSTSRLLVHDSVYAAVLEATKEQVGKIQVGLPLQSETQMGSLISTSHLERVSEFVRQAVGQGARLIAGGSNATEPELLAGSYYMPTILTDVEPGSRIAQEEVFGPVLAVMPWRTEAEMLEIANGTQYGLTASIWTSDLSLAQRTVRDLEAGYVWINSASRHFIGLPFGGAKDSGIGREECVDELLSYTNLKAVSLRIESAELSTRETPCQTKAAGSMESSSALASMA